MTPSRPSNPHVAPLEEMAEDFLYHLYRGSELMADGRYDGAREELARALKKQPHDAAAQDLLAKVYFKLGLYPRAIELYLDIVRQFPDRIPPRINLALAYLKTGQMRDAVSQLLPAIEREPEHARAWGYLGLAWSRLGEYAKAREAFVRAGHDGMARRMDEALDAMYAPPPRASVPPAGMAATGASSASTTESDDGGGASLSSAPTPSVAVTPHSASESWMPPDAELSAHAPETSSSPHLTLADFARTVSIAPRGEVIELDEAALVVVGGCAARVGNHALEVGLERGEMVRRRGAGGAAFAGTPQLTWLRSGWIGLPARGDCVRTVITLRDEALVVREDALLAFEGALLFDNAVVGDAEPVMHTVALRGRGRLAIESAGPVRALDAGAIGGITLSPQHLVAWSDGLDARSVGAAGATSRIHLQGEGFLLVVLTSPDARGA